jgi:uncharacterized membrane protein
MNDNGFEGAAEVTLLARRNNSLSPGGRCLVVGSLAAVVFAISIGFALNGAWLVAPFAGLDILLVYLAFRYTGRHAGDYESVTLRGDEIEVERWEAGRVRTFAFNRYWAQVVYDNAGGKGGGRLLLRSHGQEIEIGSCLGEAQRATMARRLKQHLEIR